MKELSIIIPMYNSEKTIDKCLKSIVNINNIEILLIDDGSNDKTKEICMKYKKMYNNIEYIYQENSGPGNARNKGIRQAKGNYIMFLDSDDYVVTENLIELVDENLTTNKIDLIYYNFEQVNKEKTYKTYHLEKFKDLSKEELIKNTISWNLPWGQFKIIRRTIIQENNIYFEEKINAIEELFFTIKVLEKSNNIYFYDKVIYKYLKRENSISHRINLEESKKTNEFVFLQLLEELDKILYEKSIYNYYVINNIHLLKLLVKSKDKTQFISVCKKIRNNKNKLEFIYIGKRYKLILMFIFLRLDFILYILFLLYF